MKKSLLFLFLTFFSVSSAFAQDKPTLVYDKRDGSVISIGYFVPNETTPLQGVEFLKSAIPSDRLDFYKRTAPGVIEPKKQAEKDALTEKEKRVTESSFKARFNALQTDKDKIEFLAKVVGKMVDDVKEEDLK